MDENVAEFLDLILQNDGLKEIKELEMEAERLAQRFDENVQEFNDLRENKLT